MTRITIFSLVASAILSCLLVLAGCQSTDGISIRKYYFAEGGYMYTYLPVGAAQDAPADYWFHHMIATDSGTWLQTHYFDKDKVCRQMSAELITPSGAVQKELRIFEKDASSGRLMETKAELISSAMYPFEVLDTNTMVIYEVKYALPGVSNQKVAIRRNRRFAGPGPSFTLDGKTYATIKMSISETVTSEGEGNATISGEGEEWYAEGLGRVYYSKSYGNGQISEAYQLVKRKMCKESADCF
jgi:hypothetical protein